ncbi:unnamed protein product, partial [Allacma fusca]
RADDGTSVRARISEGASGSEPSGVGALLVVCEWPGSGSEP